MGTLRNLAGSLVAVMLAANVIGFLLLWDPSVASGQKLLTSSPATAGAAARNEADDKTLSPYFFVKSDNSTIDQLPLKTTSVTANIVGGIADVKVAQVYTNNGRKPLEAIYVFPASTRAAVYGMKMTIGERTITAQIKKRDEARAAYEQAKQEGRSASLLEQQRPNVFQMNVANILPGDEITTELQYTELIVPTAGIYEFVYPTVVGPRYSSQSAETAAPNQKWSKNPYLHQGELPPYTFEISARLTPGIPIHEMTCTSHKVDIRYEDPSRATVKLEETEKSGGNRDFILRYRLSGDVLESGLLLYQGQEENFFLLSVQPPRRVVPAQVPPREYIFIVDVSGSMHGFPLEISKRLMHALLGNLRPTDTFNVLLFSGGSTLLSPQSLQVTPENIRHAIQVLDTQQGGGGTELLPALKRALSLPRQERAARTLVIATDGYVTVEPEAFELIRKEIGNANFFPFGIGTSVNRFLIEGMARAGSGEPFVITDPAQAPALADKFREYVQSPLLTQVKLDFDGFEAYDVEPAGVPDVFAERPVTVFGKWRGKPAGTITLRGVAGDRDYVRTIDASGVKPLTDNSALLYLWARTRVTRLGDDNRLQSDDRRITEITQLALKYNLLTAYTSFVAIDSEVRRKGDEVRTVAQPLPLPEGVSDYAVGHMAVAGAKLLTSPASPARESVKRDSTGYQYSRNEADKQEIDFKGKDREQKERSSTTKSKLRLEKITVSGSLSEETVKRIVEQKLEEMMNRCPISRSLTNPGILKMQWIIDSTGKVRSVKTVVHQLRIERPESCLSDFIETWQFPSSSGKAETTVFLSFVCSGPL